MNNNSVDILPKNECTGCSVCNISCPHNAIVMIETKEGFHYPNINYEKCTNCGVCVKKCHSLNSDRIKKDFYQEKYDIRANDEIRMKSASGGMFTLLSDYVLENNGYVCGASFTNDYLGVHHIIINDKKDLDKLRGSKYIESNLGNIFNDIKKLLNENKFVLFTGTPCQVSALNSFLLKDYDNLITADLICHGVPPQKIWKKYIKEKFNDEKIEYVSFRDKIKLNWRCGGLFIKFINNTEYLNLNDNYMKGYLSNSISKIECIHCKYRNNRVSDITLSDFWGIQNISDRKEDINKGVSRVLINSQKGKKIFDIVKNNSIYYKQYDHKPLDKSYSIGVLSNRDYLFNNLDNELFDTLIERINDKKFNVFIDNVAYFGHHGSTLTYFALYKTIQKIGYNPIMPYLGAFSSFPTNRIYESTLSFEFLKKHINIPNYIYNNNIFNNIINKCSTFLVGSDQIWNYPLCKNKLLFHVFDFVKDPFAKKIAYSASIGGKFHFNNINNENFITDKFNFYVNQFDYISIREIDQVEEFKKVFSKEVTHVMDPVFLLDKKYYESILNNYDKKIEDKNYIFVYVRFTYEMKTLEKNNIFNNIMKFSELVKKKIIFNLFQVENNLDELKTKYPSIEFKYPLNMEEWLYYIKNADYVISNSFHLTCFALIFNKQFITILHNYRGDQRLETLKKIFNLENRVFFYSDWDYQLIEKQLLTTIDYTSINSIIKEKVDFSYNWLKNALNNSKKINENISLYRMIEFLSENNKKLELEIKNIKLDIVNAKNKNKKLINKIAWWIPIKKLRDNFRKSLE